MSPAACAACPGARLVARAAPPPSLAGIARAPDPTGSSMRAVSDGAARHVGQGRGPSYPSASGPSVARTCPADPDPAFDLHDAPAAVAAGVSPGGAR